MKKLFLLLFIFIVSCVVQQDQAIVADVNGEPILLSELEYSLDFFPQYAPSKRGVEAVNAHLDLLIEKKLFSQEGRRHGFHKSEHVNKVTNWVEREEMLKELYAREIRGKVNVSEEEIQQRFLQGMESVHVRHLFFSTEKQALEAKSLLNNGVSFHAIAAQTFKDSLLRQNGGDLGFLTFDQMDPNFAETAISLKDGELSAPIRTQWGFHIIKVENRRKMVFADKSTLENRRTSLERNVRLEKEKKRGQEFVGAFMKQFDVQMINSTFNTLGAELQSVVIGATENVPNYQPVLGGKEIELMSNGLESYFDLPLISFKGGEWTIKDFMEKVRALPITKRPRLENPINFRHDIGLLVRDEFLYREAKDRGYDKLDHVQKEVKKWRDNFTFSEYWKAVRDTITVTDREVGSFFESHQGRYIWPERVHVQEILVVTQDEAQNILAKIRTGENFGDLARKYSLRKWAAEKEGDLGWVKIGDYGKTSNKAFELANGKIGGPFAVREGFVLIKKLGYLPARPKTFIEAKDRAIEEARSNKQNLYYDQLKAELYRNADIDIKHQVIEKLAERYQNVNRMQMPGLQEVPSQ